MPRSSKRLRSVIFSDSQHSPEVSELPERGSAIDIDASEENQADEEADIGEGTELESTRDVSLEIVQEVWEALREDFYEQIEQLPLSLHRSFALIGEQDKEAEACQAELLPTIRSYVKLRQSMDAIASQSSAPPTSQGSDSQSPQHPMSAAAVATDTNPRIDANLTVAAHEVHINPSQEITVTPCENNISTSTPHKEEDLEVTMDDVSPQESPLDPVIHNSRVSPNTSPPQGVLISGDSRDAHTSENPAQETPARPPGLRETDATVPKSAPFPPRPKPKTTRELLTRISFLTSELMRASEEKVGLATAAYDSVDRHVRALDVAIKEHEAATALGLREGTRSVRMTLSEENDASGIVEEDDEEPQLGMIGPSVSGGRSAPRLRRNKRTDRRGPSKHVLPRKPPPRVNMLLTAAQHEMPIDPHEPRYCYCNQVSFGEMIACDNPDCTREWFHLGCAGLTAPPKNKAKWFCRECEEALGRNKRRRLR